MSEEIWLSCRGIERFLGEEDSRVHALRGVSLDLEPATVHAVVGPSGCGKSTLLYILGLLDSPDAGSLTIDGSLIANLPDSELTRKRNELLGFIFQFHFLLEDFTAQENVMIPMRRLGRLTEEAMRERAASKNRAQTFALKQFANHVGSAVLLTEVVHAKNVGMVERGDGARFLLEAAQAVGVSGEGSGKNLDGDIASQTLVASAVDLTHATSAD